MVSYVRTILLSIILVYTFTNRTNAGTSCETYYYEVKNNDSLHDISFLLLGNSRGWKELFALNKDKIKRPSLLKPGQILRIPPSFLSENCNKVILKMFGLISQEELDNIKAERLAKKNKKESEADPIDGQATPSELLSELVEKAKQLEKVQKQQEAQAKESSNTALLEIDGLILDETRTKLGKDFFDHFYQNWSKPSFANGFTIRIIEKPVPGLGSLVDVQVNDRIAYQSRLQPNIEQIENSSKQAILYARYFLKNQPKLIIY